MKKHLILALIFSLGLGSCKFLDENPTLEVKTEDAIKRPSDVQAAIVGVYNYLQSDPRTGFSWADRYIVYADLIDPRNMRSRSTFSGDREVSQRRMTSNTVEFSHLWEAMFKSIEACNAALDVLPGISGYSSVAEEETALRGQDEAELRFMRAFNYFNLWRMFGTVPLRTTPTRTGNELTRPLPRASEEELIAAIINDLTIAEEKFVYDSPADLGGAGRATRLAATALLARVYANVNDWPKAEAKATQVIESGLSSLSSNYSELYEVEYVPEHIFKLDFNVNDQNALANAYTLGTAINRYLVRPSLLFAFEPDEEKILNRTYADQRLTRSVKFTPDLSVCWTGKYFRTATQDDDVILIRLSEMYLIRSEARAYQGNIAGALEDLNVVRNRAGIEPVVGLTERNDVLQAIENERRLEFCFEGHWYYELAKRRDWNDPTLTRAQVVLGGVDENGNLVPMNETYNRFPIPNSEITTNPNMTQNPGY